MACHRGRGSGCSRPGYGINPLLEEVAVNPTIKPSELNRAGETDSWRAQTKPCVHQDPGERSSDPTRDWPSLPMNVQESLAEAWVGDGLLQDQGHRVQRYMLGTF